MFRFDFYKCNEIPPLAWLANVGGCDTPVEVIHGSGVETTQGRFFEGAWAGPFNEWGFDKCPAFGSGGLCDERGILFIPPDHLIDRIFLRIEPHRTLVSNSLAFLLEKAGKSLPVDNVDSFAPFNEIIHGVDNYRSVFRLDDGSEIFGWVWKGLRINLDGKLFPEDKPRVAEFSSFVEYRDFISSNLERVFDNAGDPTRVTAYRPLSSISSGYDSTAITVLAAELGCDEAITFAKARPKLGRSAEDDSGAIAARILNVAVHEVPRLGYVDRDDFPEIQSCGAGSEMLSARDFLRGRLFLTGYMGDTIWDRVPSVVSDNVVWPLPAGHNLGEFRLSTPFIHVPVPFLGAWRHRAIVAISQSKEMKPWQLGTSYDRPICRRIAEDRGIPREAFGTSKRAAGVFFREEGLRPTMSPASYESYAAFRRANSSTPDQLAKFLDNVVRFTRLVNAANRKLSSLLEKVTGVKISLPMLATTGSIKSEAALIFQWSVEQMKQRYRPAFDAAALHGRSVD